MSAVGEEFSSTFTSHGYASGDAGGRKTPSKLTLVPTLQGMPRARPVRRPPWGAAFHACRRGYKMRAVLSAE
eukprot:6584166-Pyramimonas_sp.AAC.1